MIRVIVDNKIPYLKGIIEHLADEVIYMEGKDISPLAVRDADALMVRTRTRCDRSLLEGSRVKFIATATIGFDHIDVDYCDRAGITWCNAPGCNADSVAQYVHSCLLLLQRDRGFALRNSCLGVVGVGHVGSKVVEVGKHLGMNVLLCDPPRAENGEKGFLPLDVLGRECDVLTFHTPLVRTGHYPTYHLINETFLASLSKRPCLINTSRGEVVDNGALLEAMKHGLVREAVMDVWENEPEINRELLEQTFIGTPHIAGYSADGKSNATRMALDAYCRYFHIEADYQVLPPPPVHSVLHVSDEAEAQLFSYNPYTDSDALKARPEQFEYLRGHYPLRRELSAYTLEWNVHRL